MAHESLMRRFDRTLKGADRALLFRAAAERLQTGLLTPDEAALIADWFQQLADGKKPADVFLGERRGRKRGANSVVHIKGQDLSLPDHVDLCWALRQWVAQTGDEDKVFSLVAERFGCTKDHLTRIYHKIGPTLAPDPTLEK